MSFWAKRRVNPRNSTIAKTATAHKANQAATK
jgi:hypothetical protein